MIKTTVRMSGWLFSDPARPSRVIENWKNMMALAIKADFGVTVQTWRNKPAFTIDSEGGARVIGTDVTQGAGRIYKFVSMGTRVRYATMTKPFGAKTAPGVIGSVAGIGGVAFISKKRPRPGIQARRFPEVIATKWRKEAPEQLQRAIDSEVKA